MNHSSWSSPIDLLTATHIYFVVKMADLKFHGDITKEEFFLEWFGLFGRELGTNRAPHRDWTDNPQDFIKFIEECDTTHNDGQFCRPCWISAQPMRCIKSDTRHGFTRRIGQACAIEKLFFDFDDDTKYCPACDKYIKKEDLSRDKTNKKKGTWCPKCGCECKEKPRPEVVGREVQQFVSKTNRNVLIVKTYKGFHVYIFLRQVYPFSASKFNYAKKVYKELQEMYITEHYEFLDRRVVGDLNRFARVPLTRHEKSGQVCQILNENLKPTKVRSLDEYRTYGILPDEIELAIAIVDKKEEESREKQRKILSEMKEQLNGEGHYKPHEIRPCFQTRMDAGYMKHDQRLAWLLEIYYAGFTTPEQMLELCKKFTDYNEYISKQQIKFFFDNEGWNYKPYRCSTIKQKGWCLKSECPYYKP